MTDEEIIAILKQGVPLPPQERIDSLLERCLEILGQESEDDGGTDGLSVLDGEDCSECLELSDGELELAAAAGDAYSYLARKRASDSIR